MKILGIDFTSAPSRKKPITGLEASFDGHTLAARELYLWTSFLQFEDALQQPGPWIAGVDFPFGQSRRFVETIGWPSSWSEYVAHAGTLGRPGYRKALDAYRQNRAAGDKEHRRATDIAAGSISPQKLYGVPVGLMFYEGAPRLLASGVTVVGLHPGSPDRLVVEAYPGVLARSLIGRRSYKNDQKSKQTADQLDARRKILTHLVSASARDAYGFCISAPDSLADEPGADHLDALLCAVQAAWAWRHREHNFGLPGDMDCLEGWIADPGIAEAL